MSQTSAINFSNQDQTVASLPIQHELFKKIRSLIIARLIISTTLLIGAALPLELAELYQTSRLLFRFITYILVLSLIYAFMLNRIKNLVIFAYIQLLGDIVLETLVIMATGGIESPFSILYVLTIIIGCNLIQKNGAIVSTMFASVFYLGVIISQYLGSTSWWPARNNWILLPPPSFAFYIIIVNFAGFIITAFLANHLNERIHKINALLSDKSYQYHELLILNEQIVKNISTGLISVTSGGQIVSMNPAIEKMLNLPKTINHAKYHLNDVLPGYLVNSIIQMVRDGELNKSPIIFQKEIDNDKRWFQLEIAQLTQTPRDYAKIMLLFYDITDQKKLEEARRKAERWSAVAEISAGMAHEIRNPLASISGSVEVLKEQMKPGPTEEKLMRIIIRESDRLSRLISDFLNFAKPRPPELAQVSIHSLLNETIMLIKNSPEWTSTIEVIKDFTDEEIIIDADSNQLIQLVWNIIKNAVEAMPEGGTITIGTEMIQDLESDKIPVDLPRHFLPPYLKLIFKDTGIGMTPEILNRIFDPFTSFKRKGIGIGLAIVYRIIENHHGHIRVTSSPGNGTMFEIRIPRKQAATV